MRKIYIAVVIIFVSAVLLFVSSLFYLDKEKHKIYYFTLNLDGREIGSIKIDKFVTEDKIIYKSAASLPFEPVYIDSRERLALDRNYKLMSYLKEDYGDGAREIIYLEDNGKNMSFVSTSNSEFAGLNDMPVKPGSFIFKEDSPVTYLPILENYNFRLGRSQAFNVVSCVYPLLPPMKRLLTLTSIRDEYIKVGTRKVKVECLVIKIKNYPKGMLWVTKSGRSLVGIEFPDKKLKLERTFAPKTFTSEKFLLKDREHSEEEAKFANLKIPLSGTLTIPKKEGLRKAVLLIAGTRSGDRENNGLFTYIADRLAKSGYMVLRYDKRGMGSSGGDSNSVTDAEDLSDANAALEFLLTRKEIDPRKLVVIGHGKGALTAAKLASEKKSVGYLVLMAPLISPGGETDINFDNLSEMAAKLNWNDEYLKLTMKSRMETLDIVKRTKGAWKSILRTRCFLKKLRDEMNENPIDIIRKVEVPVLILYGKEDELIPAQAASALDKALEDSGNKNHKLIYYGYLGHFFGKQSFDGIHRLHYDIDKNVLDTLDKWIKENSSQIDLTL